MNGYFLIWLIEKNNENFINPYVDAIFLINFTYDFNFDLFVDKFISEWQNFLGKNSLINENKRNFRTNNMRNEILMSSNKYLNSKFILFEKKDYKLKKILLQNLLTYFTYRHFYLPKLYDDKKYLKIKMFTKGSLNV